MQMDQQMELEHFDFAQMIVGVEGWQSWEEKQCSCCRMDRRGALQIAGRK
jgi:hypothetical protein